MSSHLKKQEDQRECIADGERILKPQTGPQWHTSNKAIPVNTSQTAIKWKPSVQIHECMRTTLIQTTTKGRGE